jgi:hypothetical protein
MAERYRVATDGRLTPAMITRRSAAEECLAERDCDRSGSVSDNIVAYRSGTRSLRLGLRRANASVAGCRFDHRSSCRYGLGAATYPAVELNVQLSEEPL